MSNANDSLGIQIRHLESSDLLGLKALRELPDVMVNLMNVPYGHPDQLNQMPVKSEADGFVLVATSKDKLVGFIGIHKNSHPALCHKASLAVAVHPDFQGKGVASKLFEQALDKADNWHQIQRIELMVYTHNKVAIRLYEKFGFEIEGTARAFAFRAGEYVDAHSMARIKKVFK